MADVPAPADTPKKYIRTLESDVATLKEGGKPDLTPLKEPAAAERLIEASPILPPVAPSAPIVLLTPPPVAKIPELSPVETYSGDFSARVRDTGASTVTVLAAEQDARRGVLAPEAPSRRSSMLYTIAGLLLLIVGGGGTYYVYSSYLASSAPINITPSASAPIFVDERAEISGTGTTLALAIEQSVSRSMAAGAVRLLSLKQATTSDRSVFPALQLPAPFVLLRNINTAGSMAGIVNPTTSPRVSAAQSPFFILSVASYGETFAGMLSWEPLMPRDLAVFFPPYPVPVVATTTASTTPIKAASTTPPTAPALQPGFRDVVVANHDTRLYRDSLAHTILIYGYWDQRTLVIARNEAAFTEILRRLATSRSAQ